MDTVLSCVTIPSGSGHWILTMGTTYKVVEWVEHKYGRDPAVMCDDGKIRLMYKGFFHD